MCPRCSRWCDITDLGVEGGGGHQWVGGPEPPLISCPYPSISAFLCLFSFSLSCHGCWIGRRCCFFPFSLCFDFWPFFLFFFFFALNENQMNNNLCGNAAHPRFLFPSFFFFGHDSYYAVILPDLLSAALPVNALNC